MAWERVLGRVVIAPRPPPRGVEGNLEETRSRCTRCTRVASGRQTQRERPGLSPSDEIQTETDRSADPLPYAETKEAWMQVLRSPQAFPAVHGVVIYPSIALGARSDLSNHQAAGSAGRREISK